MPIQINPFNHLQRAGSKRMPTKPDSHGTIHRPEIRPFRRPNPLVRATAYRSSHHEGD